MMKLYAKGDVRGSSDFYYTDILVVIQYTLSNI